MRVLQLLVAEVNIIFTARFIVFFLELFIYIGIRYLWLWNSRQTGSDKFTNPLANVPCLNSTQLLLAFFSWCKLPLRCPESSWNSSGHCLLCWKYEPLSDLRFEGNSRFAFFAAEPTSNFSFRDDVETAYKEIKLYTIENIEIYKCIHIWKNSNNSCCWELLYRYRWNINWSLGNVMPMTDCQLTDDNKFRKDFTSRFLLSLIDRD